MNRRSIPITADDSLTDFKRICDLFWKENNDNAAPLLHRALYDTATAEQHGQYEHNEPRK